MREAHRLAAVLEAGSDAQQAAAPTLVVLIGRCERVLEQIRLRLAGEKITDRLVSLHDPDARPICKGKLAKQTEFGYVQQTCEITENTTGARGYLLAPATAPGNPGENTLLPATLAHADALGFTLTELALDGGFSGGPTDDAIAASEQQPTTVYIAGIREPDSPRTRRRLYRYRAGAEGRISHLKRRYGAAASTATPASRRGAAGRSSRTTSTRMPTGSADTPPRPGHQNQEHWWTGGRGVPKTPQTRENRATEPPPRHHRTAPRRPSTNTPRFSGGTS